MLTLQLSITSSTRIHSLVNCVWLSSVGVDILPHHWDHFTLFKLGIKNGSTTHFPLHHAMHTWVVCKDITLWNKLVCKKNTNKATLPDYGQSSIKASSLGPTKNYSKTTWFSNGLMLELGLAITSSTRIHSRVGCVWLSLVCVDILPHHWDYFTLFKLGIKHGSTTHFPLHKAHLGGLQRHNVSKKMCLQKNYHWGYPA